MGHCYSDNDLRHCRAGGMSPASGDLLRAHLEHCRNCAERYAAIESVATTPPTRSTAASDPLRPLEDLDTGSSPAESTPKPPSLHIAGYDLIREIQRGGQGVVYQAIQQSTRRKVAVKVLLPGGHSWKSSQQRFQREIELAAQLRHPNIISIFQSGYTSEGLPYFAMDYVRGLPINDHVRQRKLDLQETLRLFAEICGAVHAAHQRGIIHRDLKPSNILIDAEGHPRILDFGLAKHLAAPLDTLVTLSAQVVGTLSYMSPEQASGNPEQVDQRTDVYSLGVMLYELLTGRLPHPVSGSIAEMLRNVAETPPDPPARSWTATSGISGSRTHSTQGCPIDGDVETIVLKAMAKIPQRRYQTAAQLEQDIRRYLGGEPIAARRDSLAYLLRIRSRKAMRRHRISSFCGVVLLATFLGRGLGVPLVFDWTSANRFVEQWMVSGWPTPNDSTPLNRTRVIEITDRTDIPALAARANLEPAALQDPRSLRRVHGLLMTRLAASRCRAVVWDIKFRSSSPFDADFVAGVQALAQAGIKVAVAVPSWEVDADGLPLLSPTIAAAPVICGNVAVGANAPVRVPLIAQSEHQPPHLSLALAAVAAARKPGEEIRFELDQASETLGLIYSTPRADQPLARPWVRSEHLELGAIRPVDAGDAEALGLQAADLLGYYEFTVPAGERLAASTLDYQQVLDLNEAALARHFEDTVVVIGDSRSDRVTLPDGREVAGVQLQASAISALLPLTSIRRPRLPGEYITHLLAAVAGALIGLLAPAQWPRRLSLLVGAAAVTVGICWAVLRQWDYLISPLVAIVGLVLGAELAAVVRRSQERHPFI